MFKLKTIDFDKIRSMVDAAERLVDADLKDDAEATLVKLAYFINKDIKNSDNTQTIGNWNF